MILSLQLEIVLVAMMAAVTCCLPGIFLLLRGVAMMSDAISHAILLGIAVMFLVVRSCNSPLLIIGAACAGVVTVICTELLIKSKRLKQDAAIGLVFPLFFSLGVIIISQYARNVHLDIDMVLLGELAFVPFNRIFLWGFDCGPHALWVIGAVLLINVLCITLLYKELVLTTFDATLATMTGFSPTFLYYLLMILTSITAVAMFDVVGSIMVVALMITPCASAYMVTRRVGDMIFVSILFSLISAFFGYAVAFCADVSIAGSIASMTGLIFLGALCATRMGKKAYKADVSIE